MNSSRLQSRSQQWGRGGSRPLPRVTLVPRQTFTRFITDGQFEHNDINTKAKISKNYKRKIRVQVTSKTLINFLKSTYSYSKFSHLFYSIHRFQHLRVHSFPLILSN